MNKKIMVKMSGRNTKLENVIGLAIIQRVSPGVVVRQVLAGELKNTGLKKFCRWINEKQWRHDVIWRAWSGQHESGLPLP